MYLLLKVKCKTSAIKKPPHYDGFISNSYLRMRDGTSYKLARAGVYQEPFITFLREVNALL